MTYPRSKFVDLSVTENYHIITRCVRRAYLCGTDYQSGNSYEHRKTWYHNRLIELDQVFCIDLSSYAIMSNHSHLVLTVNRSQANRLSDLEVVERWLKLSSGTELTRDFLKTNTYPSDAFLLKKLEQEINTFRERLSSLSWYMKSINEYIAKKANLEDECTGHFWEGRFKSYPILDFTSFINTMIYVDLNPFRAGIVNCPKKATFTSLHCRIQASQLGGSVSYLREFKSEHSVDNAIGLSFEEYLTLIDYATSKGIKAESKQKSLLLIETKLDMSATNLVEAAMNLESHFPIAIGSPQSLKRFKEATGRARIKGAMNALQLFRKSGKKAH